MSSKSKKMNKTTTTGKKWYKSKEKVLNIIANNENVDQKMILEKSKLSIRAVRYHIYRMLRSGEIRKHTNLTDIRRVFYKLEDK